jgi:hypothetical protein
MKDFEQRERSVIVLDWNRDWIQAVSVAAECL